MTKKIIRKSIERNAAIISSSAMFFLLIIIQKFTNYSIEYDKFQILLNISMALSGIYLGFTGTVIGAFISILGSKLMEQLYQFNADKDLIKYINTSVCMSIILFCISIPMLFFSYESFLQRYMLCVSIWWIIFIAAFVAAFRIVYYLGVILITLNKYNKKKYIYEHKRSSIDPNDVSNHPTYKSPDDL